jgi:hypothetical protein
VIGQRKVSHEAGAALSLNLRETDLRRTEFSLLSRVTRGAFFRLAFVYRTRFLGHNPELRCLA